MLVRAVRSARNTLRVMSNPDPYERTWPRQDDCRNASVMLERCGSGTAPPSRASCVALAANAFQSSNTCGRPTQHGQFADKGQLWGLAHASTPTAGGSTCHRTGRQGSSTQVAAGEQRCWCSCEHPMTQH